MTERNSSVHQSAICNPQSAIGASLCHPDPMKSCGACCGLYNWRDHSRKTLLPLLEKRTSLFFSCRRDPELFRRACAKEPLSANPKLLETIHNCDFLGFVDGESKRVGCLLHPSVHRGRDLRDHCFYGAEICAGHLCPSHAHLTGTEKKSVLAALEDWYLYGLVITDIDLVKEFFRHVQARLGDSVREDRLEEAGIRGALREYFSLKGSWRFASSENRLGKYFFSHAEYQLARIEYEKNWGLKPSRFDRILLSLSSEFRSREEVREAESIVEGKIAGFVRAYEDSPFPPALSPVPGERGG